jgi:hypothetical protein
MWNLKVGYSSWFCDIWRLDKKLELEAQKRFQNYTTFKLRHLARG